MISPPIRTGPVPWQISDRSAAPIDVDPTGSGGFPYPADRGGDVKNLDWAPGGNDSIWTDPGFPVMTNVDGRKYKILVAPLIMELDSRLNLNVVGNMIGNTGGPNPSGTSKTNPPNTNPRAVGSASYHVSNQGLGPWEINPSTFLNASGNPNEWKNLFYGTSPTAYSPGPHCVGRYGLTRVPGIGTIMPGYNPLLARGWAAVDRNGIDESTGLQSATPYLLPGAGTNSQYANQPSFPANCYGTGTFPPSSPWLNEGLDNPLDYNSLRQAAGSDNRQLPIHAMHQLLRLRQHQRRLPHVRSVPLVAHQSVHGPPGRQAPQSDHAAQRSTGSSGRQSLYLGPSQRSAV